MKRSIKLRYVSLTLLTMFGFALRLAVAQILLGGLDRDYQGDEGGYVSLAVHLVDGLGFTDNSGTPTSYRVPGLPLLLAIPISLTGPNIIAIRIFMCFVESLLVPAFYLLIQSSTGSPKTALI